MVVIRDKTVLVFFRRVCETVLSCTTISSNSDPHNGRVQVLFCVPTYSISLLDIMDVDDESKPAVVEVDVPVDPLIELKQLAFDYESGLSGPKETIQKTMMETIEGPNMAPYYLFVCGTLGFCPPLPICG